MLIRAIAGLLFLAFLWSLIRFAVGLRFEKRAREKALDREESLGRRLVAEVPLGAVMMLVLEDGETLLWGEERQPFSELLGARMLLNGRVLASVARAGASLPEPEAVEEDEERERWDVRLYRRDGTTRDVRCGTVREGVSRENATRILDVVGARLTPPTGPTAS